MVTLKAIGLMIISLQKLEMGFNRWPRLNFSGSREACRELCASLESSIPPRQVKNTLHPSGATIIALLLGPPHLHHSIYTVVPKHLYCGSKDWALLWEPLLWSVALAFRVMKAINKSSQLYPLGGKTSRALLNDAQNLMCVQNVDDPGAWHSH